MDNKENQSTHTGDSHKVKVTINGDEKKIPGGAYVVSRLKEVLGVAPELQLEIKEKELIPLDDNETITVHEGEAFVSHKRRGGSS
jgi:hypothetical protein